MNRLGRTGFQGQNHYTHPALNMPDQASTGSGAVAGDDAGIEAGDVGGALFARLVHHRVGYLAGAVNERV